jgi:hypothetical protein
MMGRKIARRATGTLIFSDARQRRRFEDAVAAGLPNTVIARRFGMSPATVKALAAGIPRDPRLTARDGGDAVRQTATGQELSGRVSGLGFARTRDHGLTVSATRHVGQVSRDPSVLLALALRAALRAVPPGVCIVMDAQGKVLRMLDPVTREEVPHPDVRPRRNLPLT